jgi:hypothetical protein
VLLEQLENTKVDGFSESGLRLSASRVAGCYENFDLPYPVPLTQPGELTASCRLRRRLDSTRRLYILLDDRTVRRKLAAFYV